MIPNVMRQGSFMPAGRGTRADIAAKTARKMCAEFGSALEDLLAFIGPGISRCCFEVAAEVAEEFAAMLGSGGILSGKTADTVSMIKTESFISI